MKKILLILMMIFSFAFSAINEYKTDVYFANGILVNATENTLLLKDSLKIKL